MATPTDVSEDLCWTIVRMAPFMHVDTVSGFTGVKHHKIFEILALYHRTGQVIDKTAYDHRKYRQLTLPSEVIEGNTEERANFVISLADYTSEQFVFLGERSVYRRKAGRGMVWEVAGGQRNVRKACSADGKRYFVISALSLDGILNVDIPGGLITLTSFEAFIDGLLDQMNPYPAQNSVIVMEKTELHDDQSILQKIRDRGMKYVFLPPYCPDLDPLNLAFSAFKTYLRQNTPPSGIEAATDAREQTMAVLIELHKAMYSLTAEDAREWMQYCNYV